jgi:hypothetical protein
MTGTSNFVGITLGVAPILVPAMSCAAVLTDLFPPDAATWYAATFDRKHLDQNRRQQVAAIRIFTTTEHTTKNGAKEMAILELTITLRNGKKLRTAGLNCFREEDGWRCQERVCNPRSVGLFATDNPKALMLDL